MKNSFIKQFTKFTFSPLYWLMYIVGGTGMLGTALYYQYQLEELPCVLCIHVRLWVVTLVLVSLMGLLSRHVRMLNILSHTLVTLIAIALVERSYQLLGTERGFIDGECNFDIGLPAWLDVQGWVPWLFQIKTSCGYTPMIGFGVTMAESLLVMSVLMGLLTLSALVISVIAKNSR